MGYRPTLEAERRLRELAESQGGYFTAKQAASVGYGYSHLAYHHRARRIERVAHGVYRLAGAAISDHDDLVRLTFWSRNRQDAPQAVVSHASALVAHGITSLLPHVVHLTVPPEFSKRPPPGCKLHRARLATTDIEERIGFRVTTPLRTLVDSASASHVPHDELVRAAEAAIERGLVRKPALAEAFKEADVTPSVRRDLRFLRRGRK